MPFADELVFGSGIMDKDEIGLPVPGSIECLAGADGDHPHVDACCLLELRKDVGQQTAVLD